MLRQAFRLTAQRVAPFVVRASHSGKSFADVHVSLTTPVASIGMRNGFMTLVRSFSITAPHDDGGVLSSTTPPPVVKWSIDDVVKWASNVKGVLPEDIDLLKKQRIDGESLLRMTKEDFERCGIPIGPASNLFAAIQRLDGYGTLPLPSSPLPLACIIPPGVLTNPLPSFSFPLPPSLSLTLSSLP